MILYTGRKVGVYSKSVFPYVLYFTILQITSRPIFELISTMMRLWQLSLFSSRQVGWDYPKEFNA